MSEEIRLPIAADTTQMERNITEATRRVGTIRLNANIDTRSLDNFSRPLGRITGQADEFTKSMEAANARVLAFGASVGTINLISSAFKNLISSTNEVEEALTQIKTVGGDTFANLKEVSSGIFDIAKKTGTSFKDASEATLEFSRQGKSLKDSLESANAALILTRTTGLDAAESVKGLTTAVNVFNESGLTMAQIVNKLAAVDTAFAVGSRDLIEGISRSASVAQEAGVSFDELAAFITVLQEKTGRGGAVIGNALKTIFTRVQNPEILKDIQKLGIAVTDASGNILPATQVIKSLALEFDGLDKNLRNNLLLKVGGGFQVDKLAALLGDVALANGKFSSSLNTSANATDQADKKVKQLNQTLSASAANLGSSFKELGSNIGAITFSKDFTDIINGLASKATSINKLIFGSGDGEGEDSGNKFAQSFLKGLGSVISGPGLAIFVGLLGKGLIEFGKFGVQALQTQLNITTKSKEEALIQKTISEALLKNTEYQRELFSLNTSQVDKAERLLNIFRNQADEVKRVAEFSKQISPALYGSGLRLGSGVPEVKAATRSAGGYIPNLANAISKERAESPAGSKIIVDHSFPMGGGEKGTMIYNSNETRISNFGGSGGDAIIPNYPVNSAYGYTPNFAKEKKEKKGGDKNKILEFDASNESVAGLTLGNDFGNVLTKAKPYPLSTDNLKKYAGSPYLDILNEFDSFNVTNLPVGNIYKFRKGLNENEEKIKGDFVARLNSKLRGEIVNFILAEVSNLGLKPGGGLASNLSNLKLDILGPSTAGYMFEEVLKIPTLTDAEKVAQYSNQSATDFFDIKNLDPNFAEAYGLPKRKFNFAEVKLGQKELMAGIPKKVLNQTILEGGGANPAKFGKPKRAASGYVPSFNEEKPKTGFIKTNAVEQGNNLEKNLYDLIGISMQQRPVGGATLDIPKGLLNKFSNQNLESLGIATGNPFKTEYGDIKLSKNKDSITSLVSKFLRNRGDKIDKNLSYSSKGFSMLYKNGPKDSRETSERALSSLVDENVSLFDLIPWSLKNEEGEKTEKNTKGLQLNELGKKIKITLSYNADRLIQDSEILPSDKVLFPERYKTKNASKGYIPNFAYDLGINKDNIAIRSVTSPFDEKGNRIRGTGAVKEAIIAAIAKAKSKGFNKITADAISDASVNAFTKQFGRAVKGKNTWDISEFKNASRGYIPNFAENAIGEALSREKMQSGLPNSQISITKDSRLSNNLNPSGFAVINKRDEPNGKVPVNRIATAYENASKGFVPNFAFGDAFISGSEKSGASVQAIAKARTAVTSSSSEKTTSSEKIVKIEEDLQTKLLKLVDVVAKEGKQKEKLLETVIKYDGNLVRLNALYDRLLNLNSQRPTTKLSATDVVQPTKLTQADIISTRLTEKDVIPSKKLTEKDVIKQQEKSFGDLATKLLVYQTAISFASGTVSSFGKEASVAADLISTFGQGIFAATQGVDILKSLTGGKGVVGTFKDGIASSKSGQGFLKGAGGFGNLAGATLGGLAGSAVALGLAYKGLDSYLKLSSGSATKTGDAIDKMTKLQNKYGVVLNESQKSVVDSIKELGDVDAAGLSNIFDLGNAGRRFTKAVGGKDETYKNDLRNELRKTGLMEGGNQALASTLSSILAPIVSERLRAEKGGKDPKQSELNKALTQAVAEALKNDITSKVDRDIKNEKADIASIDKKIQDSVGKREFSKMKALNPLELESYRTSVRKQIESGRTSRIESETEKYIESKAPEKNKAVAEQKSREAAFLTQSELIKKQLDYTLQIIKAEGQIPSIQESQLSIRKELLQLSSSERFSTELNLKKLQDERSLRNEINDLYLTKGKEKINAYLDDNNKLAVPEETKSAIREFQDQMSIASTVEDQVKTFEEILKFITKRKNEVGILLKGEQELLEYAEKEKNNIIIISQKKAQASAQDSLQKTIVDRNNAAINLQKDLYSATFSTQQRVIELAQKELEIRNKINDSLFKASNINSQNPNEDPFIAQRRDQLRNIQLPAQREMQAFDLEKRKAELSDRQSIFNAAMQKGASPTQLKQLSESKNLEDSYKILGEVLSEQGNSFTKNVETAAKYFYESMIGTAETVHKILTEEYVAQDGKLYNKKGFDSYAVKNYGEEYTGAEIISQQSFVSDATSRLMQSLDKKYQIESEVEPLTAENVRNLFPSQSDQLVSPERSAKAGVIERNAEFNNLIAKKYWDLDKQRLENSITLAQRALDIEKQRVAEQLKLEQTKFEGRNALEFNPLKQQLNQASFQQDSQIKAARIEDEQNQKNYLLEARKSAMNYMVTSGSTPKDIEAVQNMTSIKDMQEALNKVAAQNVNKIGVSPEVIWKDGVKESVVILKDGVEKILGKYTSETPEQTFAKYTDTSALPADIKELEKRKEYLSNVSPEDVKNIDPQNLIDALLKTTEALDELNAQQKDRLAFASKGGYTNAILPQAPYLKTPGAITQSSAETSNKLEEIKNQTLFSRGLAQSKGQMESELMTFQNRLAKQIPSDFRDSMTAAFKELASGDSTTPLKDRLMGVASSFLQKISDAMMNNVATGLTNSLMSGLGIGSGISKMASGGEISGGSGNKDDVPAMLMGGEFVIKKSSAQKYGTAFLDALNQGKISKYANGGVVFDEFSLNKNNYEQYSKFSRFTDFQDQGLSFNKEGAVTNIQDYSGSEADKGNELMRRQTQYYQATQQTGKDGFFAPSKFGTGAIVGQKNLLAFATQQAASSKYDKISGGKDSASIDIAGGSENLTTAALNDDINIKNKEFEEAKQKAQDLYISGQIASNEKAKMDYDNQKAYEEQLRKYEEQKKAQRRQMWINAAMIVGTAALSSMGGAGGIAKMFLGSKAASSGTQYLTGAVEGSTLIDAGPMGSAVSDTPTYAWMGGKPNFLDRALAYSGRQKYAEGGLVTNNYINSNKETKNNSSENASSSSDYRDMSSAEDVKNNTLLSNIFKNVSLYNKVDKNISSSNIKNVDSNSSENNTNINKNAFSSESYSNALSNSIPKSLDRMRFSRFASGGVVNGNGYGDNVPSLLTGGEFVVNKDSAKKIGYSNLNNLNSGNSNSNSNREVDFSKMEERLDKLISTLTENKETPNITITVNSDKSEQENSSKQNSDKDLARRIKQSVLQILADEKRLGGSLR